MTCESHSDAVELTTFAIPDGRQLHLYGSFKGTPEWQQEERDRGSFSHRRWHPLRREWVVYSAHRQSRTYKPPANDCPFCPMAPDGEIPVADFSIAVFDNRFSSLQRNAPKPEPVPNLDLPVDSAVGNCEVIVYSSDHRASMATLPQERRELLVRVWGDRIAKLMNDIPAVQFVMPFENRGEEAGVTLHHPHGQIYAFSFLPPVTEKMVATFRDGYDLSSLATKTPYVVSETDTMAAVVPPYTRFPYEMWIIPKRFRPNPQALDHREIADCAHLLSKVANTYDRFFKRVCPYVMIVYAAPRGMEEFFPFHIQFQPLLRAPQKMKFIAGCEVGAGTFLVDILPETAAQNLRDVEDSK